MYHNLSNWKVTRLNMDRIDKPQGPFKGWQGKKWQITKVNKNAINGIKFQVIWETKGLG